jgi:hypothetical protein
MTDAPCRIDRQRDPLSFLSLTFLIVIACMTSGCKPDESPLKAENDQLRKQVAKQESVMASIQEGTKVMQQQIDLLNRELREAKKEADRAEAQRKEIAQQLETEGQALGGKIEAERKALAHQLDVDRKAFTVKLDNERKSLLSKVEAEAAEKQKLVMEVKRLTDLNLRSIPTVRVEEKGGQSAELPQPLTSVSKAVEEVLARIGYTIKASLKTDQRAVYVTERKVAPPASIEVSGFRNEYLLSLHSLPTNGTRIVVKADFEKLAQGGKTPAAAAADEIAEIERRLISEIGKAAGSPGKA